MPTRKTAFKSIYQFKIGLKELEPEIWRRIQVPESYSFWDLHVAIQDAMGWLDCHLHEFRISDPASNTLFTIGLEDDDYTDPAETLPKNFLEGHKVLIREWFTQDNNHADYLYDFGDSWEHGVTLEGIFLRQPGTSYPVCIAGEQTCPPEDCGGIHGYMELLAALGNPRHPEHAEMKEWVGREFKPGFFDPAAVKFDDPKERWKMAMEDASL
jgi:hypothetical protein